MRERVVPIAKAFLICQAAISIKMRSVCALIKVSETPTQGIVRPENDIEPPKHR